MKQTYIPEGWKLIKLKEILQEKSQRNKNQQVKEVLSITNSQGFVKQEDYFEGTVHSKNIENYKIVRKNQFAYNPSRINVGSIDILKKYEDGVLSPMYIVFETNEEKLSADYFKYYFETNEFMQNVKNNTQGSVRESLNFASLSEFEYLLPPLKEQKKIASILTNVDSIIDRIDEDIKNIQKQKQILMKNIFNYGIYHKKLKTTNLGQIPENWEVKKFEDLMETKDILDIMDGNHGELHPTTNDYVQNGIPFVMANNIVNGKLNIDNCKYISKQTAEKLRKGFSKEGDVLITHKGSVGNVAIVKNINTPYIMLTPQVTYYRINKQSKVITKEYLYYFFQSPNFQNKLKILSAQSTRAYIGITAQKQLEMVLPKIEEQNKIVSILSKLDSKLSLLEQKNKEYQNLKKGLMQQLLTGKVRVKI